MLLNIQHHTYFRSEVSVLMLLRGYLQLDSFQFLVLQKKKKVVKIYLERYIKAI